LRLCETQRSVKERRLTQAERDAPEMPVRLALTGQAAEASNQTDANCAHIFFAARGGRCRSSLRMTCRLGGRMDQVIAIELWLLRVGGWVSYAEIGAVRVMEGERADAGFRVHHHALGELHADFLRTQQLPNAHLIV
jgi:hypothetical protein